MKLNYEPYKEPLATVEDGFGYWGALGTTEDGELLQCHVCGKMFVNLGVHAVQMHGLNKQDYRTKFKLAKETPLISPKLRERLIEASQNVSAEVKLQRLLTLKKGREMSKSHHWQKSLEQKNREGTCPDQLIQKIQDLAALKGSAPSLVEFKGHYSGLVGIVQTTFGSWNNAVTIAGLETSRGGRKPQYSKPILIDMLKTFREQNNRRPYSSDMARGFIPSHWTFIKHFGSFSNALKEAYNGR